MSYRQSVIVCDDHLDIRRELASALRERGLQVYLAQYGKQAINRISSDDVEVVVLDLRMPGEMDGIQTAEKIQAESPEVRIIFLTAYDNVDYRNRAARANLRIERWIDKDPEWLTKTQQAVLEALGRNFANEISERLNEAAQAARITPEQLAVIKQYLTPYSLALPPSLAPKPDPSSSATDEPTHLDLEDVLRELTYYLDEVRIGYRDPAHRQLTWDQFREVTFNHLWGAVEGFTHDEYRQQLAVQLQQAVRKIEAPFLLREHIDAARLSVERLRSEKVEQHDVSACKKAWRRAGIETLPSFRKALEEYEELYRVEGPEDETAEGVIGNNDTIVSGSR
ncbi:response regulator [Candidatus Poribacteria bacterium]|nr:response regulator [Candidatus Poribacteria bacterium]